MPKKIICEELISDLIPSFDPPKLLEENRSVIWASAPVAIDRFPRPSLKTLKDE